DGVVHRLPGEAHAGQPDVPLWSNELRPAIGLCGAVPHGAQRTVGGIGHGRIENGFVAFYLRPAGVSFPTQAGVDCKVRGKFDVVLDEDLRSLLTCTDLWSDARAPILCLSQQEVCVTEAGGIGSATRTWGNSGLSVDGRVFAIEREGAGVRLPQAVESARMMRNSPPKCRM